MLNCSSQRLTRIHITSSGTPIQPEPSPSRVGRSPLSLLPRIPETSQLASAVPSYNSALSSRPCQFASNLSSRLRSSSQTNPLCRISFSEITQLASVEREDVAIRSCSVSPPPCLSTGTSHPAQPLSLSFFLQPFLKAFSFQQILRIYLPAFFFTLSKSICRKRYGKGEMMRGR